MDGTTEKKTEKKQKKKADIETWSKNG